VALSFPLPTGSLHMDVHGDLMVFDYRGIASVAMVREATRALTEIDPFGYAPVWRMDRAVWTEARSVCPDSMVRELPQFERWPVAFLVAPEAAEWWWRYARRQAERGLVRAVFTDYAQACAWSYARCRTAAAQARYEQSQTQPTARSAHTSGACDLRQVWRPASAPHPALSD
jgi:hypothetical protein